MLIVLFNNKKKGGNKYVDKYISIIISSSFNLWNS